MTVSAIDATSARSSGRTTLVLAGLGIGVLALHVIDDSFLQPQPGTSAGDHLAGGLVPLALICVASAAYTRVSAGVRAALALVFGLLALIIGTAEAGYYTLKVGPAGDDYTGLLAIPAGLLLLGLGAATLWKTRKLHDSRRRRYLRRSLIAAATLVVAAEVMFPIALGYGTTHILRPVVPAANLGTAYEDVTFTTSDGLELSGWYVPSRNGAAVIAFPGRNGPQKPARFLARHGYGVLLFDRRGESESDGDGNLFGWGGDKDILAAIEFLKSRPDVDPGRIAGIGLSVVRRAHAAGRSRDGRSGGGHLRRSRHPFVRGGARGASRPEQVARAPDARRQDGISRGVLEHRPSTQAVRPRAAHPSAALADLGHGWRRRDHEPHLLPPRPGAEVDLGDPRDRTHGRDHRAPEGVRAPRDRLPRPCPAERRDYSGDVLEVLVVRVLRWRVADGREEAWVGPATVGNDLSQG